MNEPETFTDSSETVCPSDSADVLYRFASDVGGLIKGIDHNHLVSLGVGGTGTCGTNTSDYEKVLSASPIDLCTLHDYYGSSNVSAFDQWNGLNVRVDQCGRLGKPVVVSEVGLHNDDPLFHNDLNVRADVFRQKLNSSFSYPGVVGFIPWQFNNDLTNNDSFNVRRGDPALLIF